MGGFKIRMILNLGKDGCLYEHTDIYGKKYHYGTRINSCFRPMEEDNKSLGPSNADSREYVSAKLTDGTTTWEIRIPSKTPNKEEAIKTHPLFKEVLERGWHKVTC